MDENTILSNLIVYRDYSDRKTVDLHPETRSKLIKRIVALETQLAETDEATIDLYEANLIQETINAEQDEVIIEIYEMIGEIANG